MITHKADPDQVAELDGEILGKPGMGGGDIKLTAMMGTFLGLQGLVVAVLIGLVFSRTFLKPDENTAFVLELPPYRMPDPRVVLRKTWMGTRTFLQICVHISCAFFKSCLHLFQGSS